MEFRIGEFTYKARRMDAFTQMSVISRLSPLLASGFGEIIPLMHKLREEGIANIADMPLDRLGAIATPVARELAKMSDDDRKFIISACLDLCDRKPDGDERWAKVWNPQAGRAMFDDINNDVSILLRIVLGVLQGTCESFLPASLSGSLGGAKA